MKIGSASKLTKVSPEHFKQLCAQTKLGWPMVRSRIKDICQQIMETANNSPPMSMAADTKVREIVTRRAERLLRLAARA